LLREHTVAIKPPRALWVPYELGRPLGVPSDAEFQKRVLRACLGLIEADAGPVLEDYPEDVPIDYISSEDDMNGMFCPIDLPPPPSNDSDLTQNLQHELNSLMPWYELAVNKRGRTTVGISKIQLPEAARYITAYIEDTTTPSPRDDMEQGQMLKLCCEDIKAFYGEAVTMQPGMNKSLDVEHWLWNETTLGKTLWKLRGIGIGSPDQFTSLFAKRSLVPDRQVHFKGAPVFEPPSLDKKPKVANS
jgi:hypothetical protein